MCPAINLELPQSAAWWARRSASFAIELLLFGRQASTPVTPHILNKPPPLDPS